MSDGATTGIDPRFDPRYQRGYPGHGAGETDASTAPPTAPASTPMAEARRVPDPPRPIASTTPVVDDRAHAGTDETDGVGEPAQAFLPLDPAPEPAAEEGSLRPWVIAAWFTLAAFVALGASLIWTVNNDVSYYTGTGRGNTLRDLGWTVGPALVRVGALGVVVLLTGLGVRRPWARASSQPEPSPVRSPEFFGLIAVTVAAIVLVVWNTILVGDGRMNGWSGAPDAEMVQLMALQQTASILSTAAVEAALWAVLGLLALGGVSAVRARSAQPDRP